jgi:hypothetical protein
LLLSEGVFEILTLSKQTTLHTGDDIMTKLANTTAGQMIRAMSPLIKAQVEQQATRFRINLNSVCVDSIDEGKETFLIGDARSGRTLRVNATVVQRV